MCPCPCVYVHVVAYAWFRAGLMLKLFGVVSVPVSEADPREMLMESLRWGFVEPLMWSGRLESWEGSTTASGSGKGDGGLG